ncbi:DUF3261 domain-containing protein [Jeongeupia naejangsanensis]|uniref:DUF3261 domain-containing protein n=1 Tax=Jeongeupia naejangsanensis TaxID=613195 RepID=A0ABS2BQA6_9NEIS|nr:DUF3261 domain-containing protein [Jeongeupia naejangsanensis]MBM3117126.1 DUF3261 domain-containing protein [Jeongeupia naejangsanensis]
MQPVRLIIAAAVLALAGCATLLSGGLSLLQLPPAAFGGEHVLEQRLTMRWPGETRTLDVVASIDVQRISLVGLGLGVRLFSLDYDGRTVTAVENVPMALPAERMLNDFLIVHAPLPALQAALPAGWQASENGRQRTVSHDGQNAIVVDYSNDDRLAGRAQLTNLPLHYQLTIDTAP